MQKKITITAVLLVSSALVLAKPVDGKSFDDWTVRCEKHHGQKSCFIYQNLVLQGAGSRLLHIAVGYLPGEKQVPVILVSMPLGISLPPGASIRIDDNEPIRFQIERCEPQGCRGGFKLSKEMLKMFNQGKTATVIFHDGRRKAIEVPLSLKGFSEGLKSLRNQT